MEKKSMDKWQPWEKGNATFKTKGKFPLKVQF